MTDDQKLRAKKLELNIAQQNIEQLALTVAQTAERAEALKSELDVKVAQVNSLTEQIDALNTSNIELARVAHATRQECEAAAKTKYGGLQDELDGLNHHITRIWIIAEYLRGKLLDGARPSRISFPQPTKGTKVPLRECNVSLEALTFGLAVAKIDKTLHAYDNRELAELLKL